MREETLREALIDLFIVRWWIPIFWEPDLNGILSSCNIDDNYMQKVSQIVKAIKALFSNTPLPKSSALSKYFNTFIQQSKLFFFFSFTQFILGKELLSIFNKSSTFNCLIFLKLISKLLIWICKHSVSLWIIFHLFIISFFKKKTFSLTNILLHQVFLKGKTRLCFYNFLESNFILMKSIYLNLRCSRCRLKMKILWN